MTKWFCKKILSKSHGFLWPFPNLHVIAHRFLPVPYSTGQIIKSVCVCQSVPVCGHSYGRISWSIFTKIGTDVRTHKRKNEFIGSQYRTTPFLILPLKTPILGRCPENPCKSLCFKCTRIAGISASYKISGSRNTMVTSDLRAEVEIWLFRACAMHPAIIMGTVRSLWTWLWDRYHVPQNVFLVCFVFLFSSFCLIRVID